jgi:hypothetical protein
MPGRFKVEIGDTTKRSRVLTGEETDVNRESVLEVPMDFKDAFDKDPEGSVRDYAGISTLAVTPYIVRRDLVAAMLQGAAPGRFEALLHYVPKLEEELRGLQYDRSVTLLSKLHYPPSSVPYSPL